MNSAEAIVSGGRLKRVLRKVGVMFTSLLVLLLIAEVVVRFTTDTIPPLTVRDAEIGRCYRANFSARLVNPESERLVDLRFNRLGFRGPNYAPGKVAGTVRIAVLGDSMIAALSVDEHETLVGLLQEKLTKRFPETKWEVMNFGVSGSSTWQELLAYRERVRPLEPDLVLCSFFTGNDLADNSNRLTSNPRIYFDFDDSGECVQLPYSSGRAGLSRWLNDHSRFYVWQKDAKKSLRAKAPEGPPSLSPGHLIFSNEPTGDVAHAWALAEAALGRIETSVEEDGSEFMLFLMPNAADVYADLFDSVCEAAVPLELTMERDYPERRLGEIAADKGIRFVSLVDSFRAAAPSSNSEVEAEWLFHKGRWHLNERGNRVAAERLFEALTQPQPGESQSLAEKLAAR